MLELAQPAYLLLLLLLPLVVAWHLRQRRPGVPHPSLALLAIPAPGLLLARHGGLTLRTLALALLVLALAGPRWPDLRTRIDAEGIALVMVVDVSGSMGERDLAWDGEEITRLQAAQRMLRLFIAGTASGVKLPEQLRTRFDGRQTDLIGLVCFATRPEAICPLTLGHATLLQMLDAEEPRGVPGESETNLSDALALGIARVQAAGPRRKVVVLLTDGEHNQVDTRSGWTPIQAAQIAASLGIRIYTIDAGKAGSEGENRQQAVRTLEAVARVSGGSYFAAGDLAGLVHAWHDIDRLERSPIATYQYRRYHELYPWAALLSFVVYLSALVLDQTLWRRLP